MVEEFESGVWWVGLAPLSAPDLVVRATAAALGVREAPDRSLTEALVGHLKGRRALLVLDNCEHLVEACADLADTLLRACPDLEILATSREPLRVAGEINFMVPSLSVPDPGLSPPTGGLQGYEAVQLFVERARSRLPAFVMTPQNTPAVVDICRKLDGIPLAIELAAARSRVLSVEQISEKLEDPLGLLTTGVRSAAPRQRTLRATLQWSYGLLSEGERELLGRLSVFAGGWDLEAAEVVGAAEPGEAGRVSIPPVLDLLSNLVDKSLVVAEAEPEGALRYRMLEPIRQFAREMLQESQEAPEVRRRHAEHYLALAETAEPELLGADQGRWLQRLRTELGNLRAALSWSLESGQEEERARLRLRLAAALWRFWGAEGFEEGKRWLRTALQRDPGGFPAVRAKALRGLGYILFFQQDYARAIAALEEAIALYKELGDNSGTAYALANLGYAVVHGAYSERVATFVKEGEALMQEGDLEVHPRAFLRIILAHAAMEDDDLDWAVSQLEEGLALCRELGDLRNTSMCLFLLGMIELKRGDLDRGAPLLEEGALIARELKGRLGGAYYGLGLGKVSALRGRPVRAARLWGAAEALREQMGMSLSQFDLAHSGYERDLAAVISALDESSFDAAWAEGRAMSPEQVFEYALDESATLHEEDKDILPPAVATPSLDIFALGPARVEKEGLPIDSADWTQKPRELLYLLLSHPEGRTKEQIGLALWPEASTAELRSSFHDTLYRLRRALGGKEWVSFHKGRYYFERSLEYAFDVEAFEEDVSEARRVQAEAPERAIGHLKVAVGLYGGDYLEDLTIEGEWALARQEELRRAYGEALVLLGGLLLAEERHSEAAETYRRAITHERFLEEAHRGLMSSQAALGERGRALRHYEELVEVLEEQLGASPALETTTLYESLRSGA
jgi:non-specific serine/threonine protein kinase